MARERSLPELPPTSVFKPGGDMSARDVSTSARRGRALGGISSARDNGSRSLGATIELQESSLGSLHSKAIADIETVEAIGREREQSRQAESAMIEHRQRARDVTSQAANIVRNKTLVQTFRRECSDLDSRLQSVIRVGRPQSGQATCSISAADMEEVDAVLTKTAHERFQESTARERLQLAAATASAEKSAIVSAANFDISKARSAQAAAERAAAMALKQLGEEKRANSALRQQLAIQETRCSELTRLLMQRERDITLYGDLIPVLSVLKAKYHFPTAADLARRLETLEERHVIDFKESMSLNDDRERLQTENASLRAQIQAQHSRLEAETQREIESLRQQNHELQVTASQVADLRRRNRQFQEQQLSTAQAILALHDKYVEHREDQQQDTHHDPVSLLKALDAALIARSPHEANSRLQHLTALANRIWATYFDKRDAASHELYCDPVKITEKTIQFLATVTKQLEQVKVDQARGKQKESQLQARLDKVERELRALKNEMERRTSQTNQRARTNS